MIYNLINWRDGKISAYESIWSIIRKYGYLNRISKICSKSDILGQNYRVTEVSAYYSDEYNIALLSRLIGKSKIDVKTAWLDHYVCKEQMIQFNLKPISTYLRYCPECMLRGYHSPIHQLPWVIYCPIHKVELQETCPSCNKNISLDTWIDPCGRQFAKGLICYCANEICSIFKTKNWPDAWSKSDTRPIGAYLHWLKSLIVSPIAVAAQNGFKALYKNNNNLELLTELFCFLRRVSPPPPTVCQFMGNFTPKRKLVFDLNLSVSEADALLNLVNSVGYHGICNYFVSYHINNKIRLPQLYCAKRLVNKVSKQHKNCQFQKLYLKKKHALSIVLSDSFNKIYDVFCPRQKLLSTISNPWIGLWRKGWPDGFINMYSNSGKDFYDSLPVEIVDSGLIRMHESPDKLNKIILSWHPEVYRFLSHLTIIFWEATTSALCEYYLKLGSDFQKKRAFLFSDYIEIKLPYVLIFKNENNKVRVIIFKRNSPINTDYFSNIDWDAHVADAEGYFENLNNFYMDEYHRIFSENIRLP